MSDNWRKADPVQYEKNGTLQQPERVISCGRDRLPLIFFGNFSHATHVSLSERLIASLSIL